MLYRDPDRRWTVIETFRETQLWILAAVLLLGAAAKAADRTPQGPAVLLPVALRQPFSLAHAVLEAVLAVALLALAGPVAQAARVVCAVMFAVGLAALLRLRSRDPELGCGCFGGLSTEPVGWRSLTRSGLFLAAAAATIGLPRSGWAVLADSSPWHWGLLAAEVAVVAALSPELRELGRRMRSPVPCELREVSRTRMLRRLRASGEWRERRRLLVSAEPVDVWRHGCWWLARFAGRDGERTVDVVFAVGVSGRRPEVRALVADASADSPTGARGAAG